MSTRVRVGDVEVRVAGELSTKEVKALLRACAGIALGLAEATGEPERPPMGFTVVTERADDPEPETHYTDDED